jgi:hypothetical protein
MAWTRAARARIGLAVVGMALLACDPIGPIAGGRLSGEPASGPVSDWSFVEPARTIQIETRPDDPHSVTVWCVAHQGRLYIPSRHPERKRWVKNLLETPRVRVRVDGRLYDGVAVRVTDATELEGVVPALLRKYEIEPREAEKERDVWIFRIDPPAPAG